MTLLKCNKANIEALTKKIYDQKQMLKIDKSNQYLKNLIKINENTLSFMNEQKLYNKDLTK